MNTASLSALLFAAMFLFVSSLSGSLEAYLDPGTGSMAIQLVLGGVVAVLATARLYWSKLRSFSFRLRGKTHPDEVA
jgi:hypothetical protein